MLGLLWLNLAMHATLTMIILTVAMPAAAARNAGCAAATVHARPPSCPLCRPDPTAGSEGEREGVNKVGTCAECSVPFPSTHLGGCGKADLLSHLHVVRRHCLQRRGEHPRLLLRRLDETVDGAPTHARVGDKGLQGEMEGGARGREGVSGQGGLGLWWRTATPRRARCRSCSAA